MCGGTAADVLDRAGLVNKPGDVGTVGQPETAKTQIGDSGSAMVAQKRKPRSLLSGAGLGDTSTAPVASVGAKPTLGA